MDTLAFVGKGFSTFQLVAGVLIGILMLIIGILLLISAGKGQQPIVDPQDQPMSTEMKVGIGIGLIVFGLLIPYGSWVNRKLVRANKNYAAFSGAVDMFNVFD